jgi:hypothetical protein
MLERHGRQVIAQTEFTRRLNEIRHNGALVAVFKNREKMKRENEAKLVRVLGSELDAIRCRSEKVALSTTSANGAVSDLTLLR